MVIISLNFMKRLLTSGLFSFNESFPCDVSRTGDTKRPLKTCDHNVFHFPSVIIVVLKRTGNRHTKKKKINKKSGLHIHFVPVMMDNYLTSFEIAVDVSRLFCPGFC